MPNPPKPVALTIWIILAKRRTISCFYAQKKIIFDKEQPIFIGVDSYKRHWINWGFYGFLGSGFFDVLKVYCSSRLVKLAHNQNNNYWNNY